MSKTGYRLRANQKTYILPVGDLHIGSPEFNEDYFLYCLDKIDEIKSPKRIFLMGDLIEASSKQIGNSSFMSTMSVDEQVDTVINYFRPYKNDIHFICTGNHESRLVKEFNHNPLKEVGRALRTPVGNQMIDTFNINGDPFSIHVSHGKGSSKYHYTAMSKIQRDTSHIMADMVLQGHNHRALTFSVPQMTSDGIKRKHYGFTGAFLSYGGYADSMQLPPLPEAFIQFSLSKDRRVRSNTFYIDEVAPHLMQL